MEKDPQLNFFGIWRKETITSRENFSPFIIWINRLEDGGILKDGFCIDNLGSARIYDFELTDPEFYVCEKRGIIFKKVYDRDRNPNRIIEYEGEIEIGGYYRGKWFDGESNGKFTLTYFNKEYSKELGDFLLNCEMEDLFNRITEGRNNFPFLPLDEIHFW